MSGPVTTADTPPVDGCCHPEPHAVEVSESRVAQVGRLTVRRALPRQGRRTVGPWCFVDHMGPAAVTEDEGVDIGPHPHIGLQTVTWLLDGEVLHRDSLGSEQVVRAGQLNLMSAGRGVSHSEEHTGHYRGDLHGVQLWVAQPERTRHGAPAFEHHAELPRVDIDHATVTVIVGDVAGALSPARHDTEQVGAEVDLRSGRAVMPLEPGFEHALVLLDGALTVGDRNAPVVGPGHLAYLGTGRDELRLSADARARALLIGGAPFEEPVLMWWNYVARSRDEISAAHRSWMAADERFGRVASALPRIPVGGPPWEPT